MLAVGEDGQARLWDAETCEARVAINLGTRVLTSAAFSRDGRRFATGGWDGAVRVFKTRRAARSCSCCAASSRASRRRLRPTAEPRRQRRRRRHGADLGRRRAGRVHRSGADRHRSTSAPTASAGHRERGRRASASGIPASGRAAPDRSPAPRATRLREFSPVGERARDRARGERGDPPLAASAPRVALPRDRARQGDARCRSPASTRRASGSSTSTGHRDRSSCTTSQSGDEITLRGGRRHCLRRRASRPDGKQIAASTEAATCSSGARPPGRPDQRLRGHRGDINTLDYGRDGRIVTAGGDRTVRVWDPPTGGQIVLARPRRRGHDRDLHPPTASAC